MNFVESFNILGSDVKQVPTVLGTGEPTAETPGAVGCLYMDTLTTKMYKCVSDNNAPVWEPITKDDRYDDSQTYICTNPSWFYDEFNGTCWSGLNPALKVSDTIVVGYSATGKYDSAFYMGYLHDNVKKLVFLDCVKAFDPDNMSTYDAKGLETIYFPSTTEFINPHVFTGFSGSDLKNIYCGFPEGKIAGAPWGAYNATIHYNYKYREELDQGTSMLSYVEPLQHLQHLSDQVTSIESRMYDDDRTYICTDPSLFVDDISDVMGRICFSGIKNIMTEDGMPTGEYATGYRETIVIGYSNMGKDDDEIGYGLRYRYDAVADGTDVIFPDIVRKVVFKDCIKLYNTGNCYINSAKEIYFPSTTEYIDPIFLSECGNNFVDNLNIYCGFSEGAVEGAPWGASLANIHYNYKYDEEIDQ